MKDLLITEINIFKDSFVKSPIKSHSTNRPNNSDLYQEQILYLQKELKNKDNMIESLLTQLLKLTKFIQKQKYELQRKVLVNRISRQSKNNQSDKNMVPNKD